MAYIRTFICFEIPESIKEQIREFQAQLKPLVRGVRWVKPDGIHLTLKFLGDVEQEKLPNIADSVKNAVEICKPFDIHVTGTGAFPNLKNPRVYWVGVSESNGELIKCQQAIEEALESLGFPKEKRRFSPHLTIGRVKYSDDNSISEMLENNKKTFGIFTASKVIIMKSYLNPSGAVYTPLYNINIQ